MEGKKLTKVSSDKNLPKILYKDSEKKEIKEEVNITRKKHKARTIIDNNLMFSSSYRYCEYLEQNPEFCDYMEDCILCMNNFNKESYRHLFCVFDGHGGNLTAKLCVKKFPEIFKKCLMDNPSVVFINNKLLYCANVGDSSCCLIGKKCAEFITTEDKCTNKKEQKRIEKAGGKIIDERLNGILAVSRGFGDFDLKNQGLTCQPHIYKKLIDLSLNYCVLASDGVWDALSPAEVSKIAFDNKNNFKEIAKIIVETAQERGSEDNISCIVIELNKKL